MSERLPVAMIGVGGFGGFTLRALQRSERVKLVGVADEDPAAAARAGEDAGVPHFTDNRSLLAQTKPRAVYLAVPPAATEGILTLCAGRGIHLWKEMPLGRNLDEAAAFVRRMDKANLKLAVGTQRRFAAGYRRMWESRDRLGQVFLGRAHYLFNWGPQLAWRGDKVAAGGGALIELGYHPIDLLVWMLGLPDAVYGLSTCGRRCEKLSPEEKLQPAYDTDDTASAILRYNSGLMATVVTTRCSGPVSEEVSLHGRGGSWRANAEMGVLRDPDGDVLDQVAEDSDGLLPFIRQVDAFANAVADDAKFYQCSARENLLNMAVIDAIYLSGSTAQPESPQARLHAVGFDVEQCLANRPPPAGKTPEGT